MESRQRTKIKMLFKRLLGMENEAERRELDAWLEEHPRDRRWVESMDGGREYLRRLEFLRRLNTEKELRGAMRGTSGRRVRWGWWAAVAVVFLTVGASAYLYMQERDWTPERIDADPGSFGAVLVASDGSLHDLLTRRDTIEVRYDHFVVADSAGLTYAELPSAGQAEEEEEVVEYNRLLVNRGHEYMLTLHDGTRVWLNSESDLEYPVTFPRGERRVRLNGEAYFEVAKDSLSPFIVEVGRGFDVRVLGTSFNVKAYPTDERYETTLVEGSVNVTDSAGMDVTLSPSEQLVLTQGGSYMVYDVDVDEIWFGDEVGETFTFKIMGDKNSVITKPNMGDEVIVFAYQTEGMDLPQLVDLEHSIFTNNGSLYSFSNTENLSSYDTKPDGTLKSDVEELMGKDMEELLRMARETE